MTGTILNALAIILGGAIGLSAGRQLSAGAQQKIKVVLGVMTVWVGMSTTWKAINGTFGQVLGQLGIAMLSMILGNLVGRLLRFQRGVTALGRYAERKFSAAAVSGRKNPSDGFVTATILFCVGPMAILGSFQDGLNGNYRLLALKAVMDGVATIAFVGTFGPLVILSALPVFVYQGTLTLSAGGMAPYLQNQALLDSMNATGGLMVTTLALVIFEIRKVPLADYLPSLAIAPLLTAWWR